jgi:hypothetical protein
LFELLGIENWGPIEYKLLREENGNENRWLQRAGARLDCFKMTCFHALLATTMRSRHPHASTFGFHLPAAGMFRRSHLGTW